MANEVELMKFISQICKANDLGNIHSCKKQNLGFNRVVYTINDTYVIKVCINHDKESGIQNEIQYYEKNPNYFNPKLIAYDLSKKIIPHIYTIEEKINGDNLFNTWGKLDEKLREKCLLELVEILRTLHKPIKIGDANVDDLITKYNTYLEKIKKSNILPTKKIEYLNLLKNVIPLYFSDANFGYIHGDIHFNNLIYCADGLKLIDFECYDKGPLDKDFDSINRMARNPNSLIKKGLQFPVNPDDYTTIMPFLKQHYPEICGNINFDNRLLIYDCINSLKWLYVYPDHEPYHDILFDKGKKLIK